MPKKLTAKPAAKHVAKPAAKRVAKRTAKPVAKRVAKPVAEPKPTVPMKKPSKAPHRRRLTDNQVRKIRKEAKAHTKAYMDFAVQYKVSPHTIHCLIHNKTYRDVEEEKEAK